MSKYFDWDEKKNLKLKQSRNITFEEIIYSISDGKLLDVVTHKNSAKYPNQKIFIVEVDNYAYIVPFIENEDHYFLKTIFPSRKATRTYIRK